MSPRQFRLLVTDIDGTLTTPERVITDAVQEAVREAQRRGVRVCLATGRAWQSGQRYFEMVSADPPGILFNGGLIYDFLADRVLSRETLTHEHAGHVIEALDSYPDLAAHIYLARQDASPRDDTANHIYVRWMTPLVEATARQDHLRPEAIGDLRLALDGLGGVMKFRILGARERLDSLIEQMARRHPTNHVYSERESLEVLPPGVSKGTALKVMATRLGIAMEDIVAVGNDFNDLTMIQVAGLGVAMADAPREVQDAADEIAPTSRQDGLAHVIRKLVLGE
jgi:Cof subfamily protein (haloacid dehalogenase superfamily)